MGRGEPGRVVHGGGLVVAEGPAGADREERSVRLAPGGQRDGEGGQYAMVVGGEGRGDRVALVQGADHDVLARRGPQAVEQFAAARLRHRVQHGVPRRALLVLREQVNGRGVAQPVDEEPRAFRRRPPLVERRPDGRNGPLRERETIHRARF
jgi:hypothetical protein